MLIPDLKVFDIVNFFISYVATDYSNDTTGDKSKNIINDLFGIDDNGQAMKLNKLIFLNEAINLLYGRDVEVPTKLDVSIGYNQQRAQLPHVHIMLANKTKGKFDAIGLDQGEYPEEYDADTQMVIFDKVRTYSTSVLLMVTGNNAAQVLTIQYFLEAMFDMLSEQMALTGLLNHNISAQDLQLYDQLAPRDMFSRCLVLNFDYQTQITTRQPRDIGTAFALQFCDNIGEDNGLSPDF